jgi:DNA replication and repair protein RecF
MLEAIVLLALGRSHRTTTDAELIRWGTDFLSVVGVIGTTAAAAAGVTEPDGAVPVGPIPAEGVTLGVTLQSGGGRKRIAVNGVPRRPATLSEHLRVVLFAPEEMLLVVGPPALRRSALDILTVPHDPTYQSNQATYGHALQQRNSLLRAIREGEADRSQLRYWDEPLLVSGAALVAARLSLLELLAEPLADAHHEIAETEGRLTMTYATNAPSLAGESVRDALARRLVETAEKEVWNGTTLIGPHRDDLSFSLEGRDLTTFASRGQQRTAILALKLAELYLLSSLDGRPPLLLLDDVFSELDPVRRGHLVRRIAELPQVFITTTAPDEIDPELRRQARALHVVPGDGGARVEEGEE